MTQTVQSPGAEKRRRSLTALWKRTFEVGVVDLFLGFCLRRSFAVAGVLKVTPGWPLPRIINSGGRIEAESCRFFPGVRIECWKGAVLKIGEGTYFNRGTEIVASHAVSIGSYCKIARDVIIMDTDQHALDASGLKMSSVVIEDRVWLGSRAIVLKGVRIGHDSIVGAGAVVTKSVPPYSVVVGSAARVIRTLQSTEESEHQVQSMLEASAQGGLEVSFYEVER